VPRATLPAPTHEIHQTVLANGLRVVLAPDRSAPVVGIGVLYDVGMRSEPEGRTGFAHLFEHLMFQGSANLEKLEHFRYVQSSGGTFNGSTHFDYTNYFEALPSNALERGIFLEADRMLSPRITQENLENQIAVVKEEIRVNVLNRPYGGFPWIDLPAVLFDSFANSHNGYGDFVDLESATVQDAAQFFDRYYAPANAVLSIAGDLDVDETMAMIERHFGIIKRRKHPVRPSFSEAELQVERHGTVHDAHAPLPAVALGYRIAHPVEGLPAHLARVLLAEILTDGDASRLQMRLVQRDGLVTDIGAYLGEFGDPFDDRDPTTFTITAHYADASDLPAVIRAIDEEIGSIADSGTRPGELDRVRTRLASQMYRQLDAVLGRTLAFAKFELIYGRAQLLLEIPGLLSAVTDAQIRAAAVELAPQHRAVVELIPGGTA
jgi:zinc protease